jgi:hypothetical protein
MSCRRLLSLALVLALGGCGSSASEQPRSTPTAAAPAATAAPQEATDAGPKPCHPEVAKVVGPGATMTVSRTEPGLVTCRYRTRHVRLSVQEDTNPQTEFRFERAVVERGQNAVWGHDKAKAPRQLFGIGQGADWFPADRDLLTLSKNGKLLVDVQLEKGGSLKLSRAVARATLASA